MKTLLTAIKAQLQVSLADVRDPDIFIAPHVNYIPAAAKLPCVAIKDGRISRKELTGGAIEKTFMVQLAVYVNLRKDEAGIMGDAATEQKGVLDIVSDIHSALHQNLLNITGMISAFCREEMASELFGDESGQIMRKIITYQYEAEV